MKSQPQSVLLFHTAVVASGKWLLAVQRAVSVPFTKTDLFMYDLSCRGQLGSGQSDCNLRHCSFQNLPFGKETGFFFPENTVQRREQRPYGLNTGWVLDLVLTRIQAASCQIASA